MGCNVCFDILLSSSRSFGGAGLRFGSVSWCQCPLFTIQSKMETKEIYNINIAPLVTAPFAVQWSPDNQISIITSNGVHIFELLPTPMSSNSTIKFARFLINPPDTLPAFVDEINRVMWDLKHQEVYSLLMEEMITPKLENIVDRLSRIVKVAWSPKDLIHPSQCVLAIVTAAGTVELLHKHSTEWYSICDVSSFWLDIVQSEIKSNLDKCRKSSAYATITTSMRQLQACSVTWSELFTMEGSLFVYLFVAHYSGDISIWKIHRITNFTESMRPMFAGRIRSTVHAKINVFCWHPINTTSEHLLVAGYIDGRICAIKLSGIDNNLQMRSTAQYIDPDCIAIDYLHIISEDESNLKILATKGFFLLLLCLDSDGVLRSTRCLQVQGFNVTGVLSVAPQQFLITTQDSRIFGVDVHSDNFVSIRVKCHLPKTQYLGLAHSPNKVIFLGITSPNMAYDHLIKREPSTMHMFVLKGAIWDPLAAINNSTNLANVWDCMELLRLKAIKSKDPTAVLHLSRQMVDSLSLHSLQLSMWMTIITKVSRTKKTIPNIDHIKEDEMTRTRTLIFVHSACAYLDRLTGKAALLEEDLLAVSLLRNYLKVYLASEDRKSDDIVHPCAQETLNATECYPNQVEKCNLCGEKIKNKCLRGHKLPRCAITLLQVTSMEYLVCPICNQIFHQHLEEIYEEPRCHLCDVPILRNPYAFDVEQSKLYGTNLSQSRVNIAEPSNQAEELKTSDHASERKEMSDTLNRSSIIINDSDDESGRITERWEEF